jgi:trypsin
MKSVELTVRSGSKTVGEGETHYVAQIIKHPDYDFCILRLYGKIFYDPTRRAIALPDEDDVTAVGEFVRVLGWGQTMNPLESSDFLRAVDLIVIDDRECEKMYEVYNVDVEKNKICATHPDRVDGKDACQGKSKCSEAQIINNVFTKGDSGGPLQRSSDGKLIGIVSFGLGCAKANYAGIYSRVSSCRTWIRDITGV